MVNRFPAITDRSECRSGQYHDLGCLLAPLERLGGTGHLDLAGDRAYSEKYLAALGTFLVWGYCSGGVDSTLASFFNYHFNAD